MSTTIQRGVVTPTGVAMPEWLSRLDSENGSWTVQQGQAVRGDAWTNRTERIMRVPYGDDDLARVVRAHEMMHAKVSPMSLEFASRLPIEFQAIVAAEEFRVNTLCSVAGFDMDNLRDGSESHSGKRLAENGDWNSFLTMICATAGTKACKDMLRGAGTVDKEFAERGKTVEKAIIKKWNDKVKRYGRVRDPRSIKSAGTDIGNTKAVHYSPTSGRCVSGRALDEYDPNDIIEIPYGFLFAIKIAQMVDALMKRDDSPVIDGEEAGPQAPSDEEIEAVTKAGGRNWAPLVIDRNVPLTRRVAGNLGRRRIATNIGVNPRRIGRMLTDPEKRVFDRTIKGSGGVILIDQSGSMRLSDDDVMALVNEAPGCVIIGYSHLPNSTGHPNAWVLADRGKVCSKVRTGNGGNGVDYPALVFANKLRKKGEPLVWVCDGHVTVSTDEQAPAILQEQVASFVRKHNVHMVGDVREAVNALGKAKTGARLATRIIGSELNHAAMRLDKKPA